LTVSVTPPPLPLLLALAGVVRRAVAPRFAPLLDARVAFADRVERPPLRAGAVFARAGFLVPELLRLDAFAEFFEAVRPDVLAELLDRVLPLCGVLSAMSNPLVSQ
jgi:hypothetical protein